MPTDTPIKIKNKFYKDLREFTAWSSYGKWIGHTIDNDLYIQIPGILKRMDLPDIMQRLVDHSWKSFTMPTGQRPIGGPIIGRPAALNPAIGRALPPGSQAAPTPMRLRTAFGSTRFKGDWAHVNQFEIVGAYTFRGETRDPVEIQKAAGFSPPIIRTDDFYTETMAKEFAIFLEKRTASTLDAGQKQALINEVKLYIQKSIPIKDRRVLAQYRFWHSVMKQQQYHIQAMTADSFMKGYISTSRDISIARAGTTGALGGVGVPLSTKSGFIYVLRVESGFLLKKGVGGVVAKEGEVAHLGQLPWRNVYGFLDISHPDVIYLRNEFEQKEFDAFKLVLASMSNHFQGR